jgi:hypothetical protein
MNHGLRHVPLLALGLLLGTLFTVLQAVQDKRVEYYALGRATPETLVILKVVPNSGLICAEPDKGTVACRTVGEFRTWVRDRPAVKK